MFYLNGREAYRAINRLKAMRRDAYVSPAYVALIYQVLGDKQDEFAWYDKAYEDRAEWLLWLNIDPMFDGERNDLRFLALVKRVGVAQQIRTRTGVPLHSFWIPHHESAHAALRATLGPAAYTAVIAAGAALHEEDAARETDQWLQTIATAAPPG